MFSDVDKSLRIDGNGNVVVHNDEAAIRQAIELNLAALRGEYVRSLRGSNLLKFIGRPFTDANTISLRQEIENVINNLDNRITNSVVKVRPNIDAGIFDVVISTQVTFQQTPITINTRIRNTLS